MRKCYYDRNKKVLFVCLADVRSLLQPEKKSSSRLSGGCAIILTTGKKKFYLSVWRVRDRYYDRKLQFLFVCLAGAQSLLRPKEKKDTVVCLAGARSLLQLEKN